MKNSCISIYLSKEEFEKAEAAKDYGVLTTSTLFKVLIKNGLDELEGNPELIFRFDKKQKLDKASYKTKVIKLDRQQYDAMERICASTPFSMSSLAKYIIMPQVNEILEKKGWIYKP